MENKQKAIEKSYGEHWEAVKDYVDENGWCVSRKNIGFEKIKESIQIHTDASNPYYWRPKSLQGIETNNGWIKIESEDIYDDWFTAWVFSEGIILYATWNPNQEYWLGTDMCLIENVTHYQPIVKPQNPIY